MIKFTCTDTGRGMSREFLVHAFEPFSQENTDARTTFTGTGLGLAITKQMVELMEGTISLKSEQNVGTTISVTIPFRIDVDYTEPQEDAKPADAASLEGVHVLLVEDNELNMEIAEFLLKKAGITVTTAYNGQEAVDVFRTKAAGTFDVILMDIMMPEMNGYELCRKIKEDMNINHIQVILLTARTDEQSHLDGYKTGADAYMEKPFEINSLLENVRNRLYLREQIKLKYTHSVISDTEKPATSADDTFIFKLNKVIIENMENEGLNVDLISQELGISRASLYNRLKALTGMGANEYVNKLRIEKAMELLRQTELNMTEIAEHTGFSTSRYFSTAFKKYTGITPTQYKENPDTLNNRPDK